MFNLRNDLVMKTKYLVLVIFTTVLSVNIAFSKDESWKEPFTSINFHWVSGGTFVMGEKCCNKKIITDSTVVCPDFRAFQLQTQKNLQ